MTVGRAVRRSVAVLVQRGGAAVLFAGLVDDAGLALGAVAVGVGLDVAAGGDDLEHVAVVLELGPLLGGAAGVGVALDAHLVVDDLGDDGLDVAVGVGDVPGGLDALALVGGVLLGADQVGD